MELPQIKTNKGFWCECLKSAFRGGFRLASPVSLALFIVLGIIRLTNPRWWQELLDFRWGWLVNDFAWLLPLIVFVIILGIVMFRRPYNLYKEKAEKVDELEREQIELVVDNTDQFVKPRLSGVMVCMVGIKTSAMKTVNDVRVFLTHINGNKNSNSDSPLNPTESRLGDPPNFNVNPGEALKLIEVVSCGPQEKHKLGIHYYTNYQEHMRAEQFKLEKITDQNIVRSEIDIEKQEVNILTLYVTGQNMKPVEKDFVVEVKGEKLLFYPA